MSRLFSQQRPSPSGTLTLGDAASGRLPLHALRVNSPVRPVDWRWQKALRLRADGRQASRLYDDESIATAVEFQAALSRCTDEWATLELDDSYPSIVEAYRLYDVARGSNAGITRWELEASLLVATDNFDTIAARIGCTPEAVSWYERLFFNVRDRMNNLSYLMHHAIGQRLHTGANDSDVEILWKLAAVCGGAQLLADMVRPLTPAILEDPARLRQYYREQTRNLIDRRATIGALTLRPRDAATKLQLLELHQTQVKLDTDTNGTPDSEADMLREGVLMMFEALDLSGPPPLPGKRPDHVLPNGVELRAAQLVAKAKGNLEIPEELYEVKFPPSRDPVPLEPGDEEPKDEDPEPGLEVL